jgi:hypothetical protein
MTNPDDTPYAFGSRIDDDHWVVVPKCASFYFRPDSDHVTAQPEPLVPPEHILEAYYGIALPMAVQVALGRQALHASAVVMPEGGVLAFSGITQAGKSTLAYGLSRRGYPMWADDVVAVEASATQGAWSLRLPFQLKLRAPSAAYFQVLPETDGPQPGSEHSEWARAPLAALCVLERSDSGRPSRSAVARLSPTDALMAVLSHAYWFQPQTRTYKRRMMRDYLDVVARVPVLRTRVDSTLNALPALLDEIEEKVGECT